MKRMALTSATECDLMGSHHSASRLTIGIAIAYIAVQACNEAFVIFFPQEALTDTLSRRIIIEYFIKPASMILALSALIIGVRNRGLYNLRFSKIWENMASGFLWGVAFCGFTLLYISLTEAKYRDVGNVLVTFYASREFILKYFFLILLTDVLAEETFYRSLLWGLLRAQGMEEVNWSGKNVLCMQAILFWLMHSRFAFYHLVSFWMYTLFSGVLLGVLAYRERSILSPMLAHAMVDTFSLLAIR